MNYKSFFLSLTVIMSATVMYAQAGLDAYVGTWKITPSNPSHSFSRITITNSGNSVTIKFKKSPFKTYTGRINPSTNRLEPFIDDKGYYFVIGSTPNTMVIYELGSNVKVGDFVK